MRGKFAALIFAVVSLSLGASIGRAGITERASVSSADTQSASSSWYSQISANGGFVAFMSIASDLVPEGNTGGEQVFVRDRLSRTTELVSVSSAGEQADGWSSEPCISTDGRFVAFESLATDLVEGDTNDRGDVFLRDRLTRTTERVSVSGTGEQANGGSSSPSLSADGRFIAFASGADNLVTGDTNNSQDIFVRDTLSGTNERVSVSSSGEQGNGHSYQPSISADGRLIAFSSRANNLVPGDSGPYGADIFVHDRLTRTTERVSISSAGEPAYGESWLPSISADGRFVAFESWANNLVPGDANYHADVFVHDRLTRRTELVSVSTDGQQGNHDSRHPSVTADGRFVAFVSYASNLVPGDTNDYMPDIFVRDRLTATVECASVSSLGERGNNQSSAASISGDGRLLAFSSDATNLVPGDTNNTEDVFVRDRWPESVPPETTITFGPCAFVISTNDATICWVGSDNETLPPGLRYSWRLDSAAWQPFSSATCANLAGLCNGAHLLEVMTKDVAQNEDPTPAQCSFTVDLAGPSVSVTSPAQSATVKGVVNISAAASHSSGISKVEFYAAGQLLGADATAPYSCAWDIRPTWVAEGLTQICAKAYANSGKVAWACVSVTVDNCTFDDVAKSYLFWRFIEGMVAAGVTSGCSGSPPLYCPSGFVTRAQMAKLICKAAGKTWLDATTPTFSDVPKTNAFYGWIERLAYSASWGGNPPTSGCGAGKYCPAQAVTRGQMAKLICKAAGKRELNKATPTFSDVGTNHLFYGWIERLADAGSWGGTAPTSGCTTTTFCPNSPATRGQMAKFLCLAFGLAY